MLDEAKEHDMIVYWGSLGFSVRMPLDPQVTVMYGYPPDDFQVYTRDWSLDDSGRAELHQRLREIAPFSLSGQYTNKLPINEETLEHAYATLAFMWDEVTRMMAEARAEDQPS